MGIYKILAALNTVLFEQWKVTGNKRIELFTAE